MRIKRILSSVLSILMLMSILPLSNFITIGVEAETVDIVSKNSISIGDCITLGTYLGESIVWRCVSIDENGPLMLSEKILCFKSFDAKGNHGDYLRNKEGTNNWKESCLRHWLNSEGAIDWSERPAVPSAGNVFNGYNPYSDELGFLSSFSARELNMVKEVEQKTYLNELDSNQADGGTKEYTTPTGSFATAFSNLESTGSNKWYQLTVDKFFLLNHEQAAAAYENMGADYLTATATASAVTNDTSKLTVVENPYKWWLRTPGTAGISHEIVSAIGTNGKVELLSGFSVKEGSIYHSVGVRPAFYLNVDCYKEQTRPALSADNAEAFIGFLTNGVNPQTQDGWRENEIKSTTLYQIMTGTYTGENFDAQAQSLVMYATAATSALASKATDNSAFLNKTITEYLEKEAGKYENLDAEIINEYQNAAAEKLTEFFQDTINMLLPVSADSIFNVTEIYGYYSTLSGAPAKAEKIAERVVAALETGMMVVEYEKAGRYTYFSAYLSLRGGYESKDDPIFQMIMSSNQTIISDNNWIANLINVFTWITNKESFNKHYDLLDEWAEYIYQLDCYIKGRSVETNGSAVTEESLQYLFSESSTSITATNTELSGQILLPNSIANSIVTQIGSGAFENQTTLESVKLGNYVETIGSDAFKGCTALKSVVVTSNVVTIEKGAFEDCESLETVVIPDSIIRIEENAFSGCSENLVLICSCYNSYVIDFCVSNEIECAIVHNFSEYISDENGNCDYYGTVTAECEYCEETDTIIDWSSIEEHVWSGTFAKLPTEVEEGEYTWTCENCGEFYVELVAVLDFSGVSLSLQHNLAINYRVDKVLFEDIGYTDPYVIVELDGEETVLTEYTEIGEYYVFSFSVATKDQTVKATLYATYEEVLCYSHTEEYNLSDYTAVVVIGASGMEGFAEIESAIQASSGDGSSYITLQKGIDTDVAVDKDVYLDLNGYSITGTVTVAKDCTLYGMDTKTDDYTVEDGQGYGKITGAVDGVIAQDGYLMITENGETSFHRLNLDAAGVTVRTSNAGIYYQNQFGGDEVIKRNIVAYGTALGAGKAPDFRDKTYTRFDDMSAWKVGMDQNGNSNNLENGTLLKDIMRTGNAYSINSRNANMKIYSQGYVELPDGTIIKGDCVAFSLREMMEGTDSLKGVDQWFNSLKETQKAAILEFYDTFKDNMQIWNIPNIKAAA